MSEKDFLDTIPDDEVTPEITAGGEESFLNSIQDDPEQIERIAKGVGEVRRIETDLVFPLKFTDEMRGQIPEEYHQGIEDTFALSNGLDEPAHLVYDLKDQIIDNLKDAEIGLGAKVKGSLTAGIGDLASGIGHALKSQGIGNSLDGQEPGINDDMITWGRKLQGAYIPPFIEDESKYKYNFQKILDAEWLATHPMRSVPMTVALIPAAIAGASVGTTVAGAYSLGSFGTLVMGSLGAGVASAPMEAALEAGGTYEAGLERGDSPEVAKEAAETVFIKNMALLGISNTAEFMAMFAPMKIKGKVSGRMLSRRAAAIKTTGSVSKKVLTTTGMEGAQERLQEVFQLQAEDEAVPYTKFFDFDDPRLNDAQLGGMVFGFGFGGVGSVYTALTDSVETTMEPDMRNSYLNRVEEIKVETGVEDQEAKTVALNELAETPEGKAHIEDVVEYLQNPDNSQPDVKIIGVEEDEEGIPTSYTMVDREGNEFTVAPGATPAQIEAARKPDEADAIIASEEEVEALVDEFGQPLMAQQETFHTSEERTTLKQERKRTFEPAKISQEALPEDVSGELSPWGGGKYFHSTAEKLQSWIDKSGDGFLYRVTIPDALVDGFDVGLKDYPHRFVTDTSDAGTYKSHTFTSSLDDVKKIAKSRPDAIVYRIMPQDIDAEFTIHVSDGAKGVIHVHSPKPAHIDETVVIYQEGQWSEEQVQESRRFIEERRVERSQEGKPLELRTRVGRPEQVKGEVTPAKKVRAKLNKITKGWAKLGTVVQSVKDLPAHLSEFVISKGGENSVQGIFDPKTKKVFFVADNIRPGDNLNRIALHEIIGHYGFESIIESSEDLTMMEVINEIQRLKDEGNPLIVEAAKEVADLYKDGEIGPIIEAKEIIAHIAQRGRKLDILKRIIAAIKAFIKSTFGTKTFTKMSENDILYLIQQSSDFVRNTNELASSPLDISLVPAEYVGYKFSLQSPIWYSRLSNLVLDFNVNKQPASAWKQTFENWIKKNKIPKALQEEVEWSGLLDSLDSLSKTRLTKLEIINMIREGGVKVEETILGGPDNVEAAKKVIELESELEELEFTLMEEAEDFETHTPGVNFVDAPGYEVLRSKITAVEEEIQELKGQAAAEWSKMVLPGGQNYKELMLTLPQKETSLNEDAQKHFGKDFIELNQYQADKLQGMTQEGFEPSHFSQFKNLLVHVRFDERVIDGKRVLFINEIQSDWAKSMRGEVKWTMQIEELPAYDLYKAVDENGRVIHTAESEQELNDFMAEGAVPDAPFIKSTNATTMLALKRMIKYAVDEGFDSVAWPAEAQQVYDIEQWGEVQEGGFTVQEKIEGSWVDVENIEPFDTKEEADKAVEDFYKMQDEHKYTGEFRAKGEAIGFSAPGGQDVSAIVNRYIKVMPKLINEFLKKQMGAKVKVEKIKPKEEIVAKSKDEAITLQEYAEGVLADVRDIVAFPPGINSADFTTTVQLSEFIKELQRSTADFSDERAALEDIVDDVAVFVPLKASPQDQIFNSIPLSDIASQISEEGVPLFAKKKDIRQATGVAKDDAKTISERKALFASFKKAAQAARMAHKAGKDEEREFQKGIMKEKLALMKESKERAVSKIKTDKDILKSRRGMIRAIQEFFNLTDNDLKKISKKDIRLMSNWEFKKFKDDLKLQAAEFEEHAIAKASLIHTIFENRLEKVDNYRKSLELPAISKMTTEQLQEFDELIQGYHEDVFLTQRELETVEHTDLMGIKTVNEAKKRLAEEAGISVEELSKVKTDITTDKYRWDTSLAEKNPFYGLLVTQVLESLISADLRVHEIESKIYDLAKKSEKSRDVGIVGKLIPQDKQILEYLEAGEETKQALASVLTPEQLELAHYMQEYFGQALEYLLSAKSLEKGVQNYFVHMRRSFLETAKDDGLLEAFKTIFKNYEQDQLQFGIMDDDTGNILPLQKFFQYSLQRTGDLVPTQNITKAFLTYVSAMEKKKALDAIIPKMSIYAQVLTPQVYTAKGLEMDRSLKKFVNEYINNKKGRRFSFGSLLRQGGKLDLSLTAMRTFITMMDLGLNIPVGMASIIGEQVVTNVAMGAKKQAKGTKRMLTKKGKRVIDKYEGFIGRSLWEELSAPGKEVGERIATTLFSFFHLSSVNSNKQFLLGMMTDAEWKAEELTPKRLAELKLEIGRWRKIPGSESLVGSTSIGKAGTQYKGWAIAPLRTVIKDIKIVASDIKSLPSEQALSSKEAKELYRVIGMTTAVLLVGTIGSIDEDDDSFIAELRRKMYRESLTILQALDPSLWIAVPRMPAFLIKLVQNLESLVKLEEYVSPRRRGELKGATKLVKQFTPRAFKTFQSEKGKGKAQPLNQ